MLKVLFSKLVFEKCGTFCGRYEEVQINKIVFYYIHIYIFYVNLIVCSLDETYMQKQTDSLELVTLYQAY